MNELLNIKWIIFWQIQITLFVKSVLHDLNEKYFKLLKLYWSKPYDNLIVSFRYPEFVSFFQDILTSCCIWKTILFFKKNCKNPRVCKKNLVCSEKFYLWLNPSGFWRLKFPIYNCLKLAARFLLSSFYWTLNIRVKNLQNSNISSSKLNV